MEYFTVSEPLIMVYVMKTVEEWGIQGSVESGWRLNRKRAQRRRLILARDRDRIIGDTDRSMAHGGRRNTNPRDDGFSACSGPTTFGTPTWGSWCRMRS